MKTLPYYSLFQNIWEYLDFKRAHSTGITLISADGQFTTILKKSGKTLHYSLSHRDGSIISTHLQRFRATESRLRQFHTGCARIARDMCRYLRTQDPKWLNSERPFGALHGGIVLEDGGVIWRGNKDDIDPDEWIDLVGDEQLARLLDRVDRIGGEQSDEPHPETACNRAWKLLETVPKHHEFHVEVLRRRLLLIYGNEEFKDLPKAVRWARAIVEAEPHEVTNWWWLESATERLEGKSAAVEVLREGIRRHGADFSLYYSLANHHCALEQLTEAREAMLLALEEDPFALEGALESDCFAPIHEFIQEQMESEWHAPTREFLERVRG